MSSPEMIRIPEVILTSYGDVAEVHCLQPNLIEEHLFWPPHCSWSSRSCTNDLSNVLEHGFMPLLVSCFAFLLPALVHAYCGRYHAHRGTAESRIVLFYPLSNCSFRIRHVDNYLALLFTLVTISSVLCDVWWVHSIDVSSTEGSRFDSSYGRRNVAKPLYYQADCCEHLGRLLDRSIAILFLAPAVVFFNVNLIWQARSTRSAKRWHTFRFFGALFVALLFGQLMDFYKDKTRCFVNSFLYREHNMWHIQWHYVFAVAFAWSRISVLQRGDGDGKAM